MGISYGIYKLWRLIDENSGPAQPGYIWQDSEGTGVAPNAIELHPVLKFAHANCWGRVRLRDL